MNITDILQKTNDINDIYCDMQDAFFRQHIGDHIEYKSLLDDLHNLINELNSLSDRNANLKGITIKEATSNQLVLQLERYQICLQKSIAQFICILENLYQKSEGIGKYSFFKYNSDQKNLKKLEQQRMNIGNILQMRAVPFMANTRQVSEYGQNVNDEKAHSKRVRVNIIDPTGGISFEDEMLGDYDPSDYNIYRVEEWKIGEGISKEQYEKSVDPMTNELYLVLAYQDGKARGVFLNRQKWQQVYKQMKEA